MLVRSSSSGRDSKERHPKAAGAAQLLELLSGWQLLPPEQLDEAHHFEETRRGDPRALARRLVHAGWLTGYQVNELFRGRGQELVFGHYVLLERLGEGGMGQVFKAYQRGLRRLVAIKVLRRDLIDCPLAVHRFQREVEAISRLSHANIVLAYDAGVAHDRFFIVMEYVAGCDLDQLVRRCGPLPVALACDYVRQAALGLQHAHERGLIHRDVKPSNLLLAREPAAAIKIVDLGLARLPLLEADHPDAAHLTGTGTIIGTPDYLAPEQAADARRADHCSDIYALGCSFYWVLTGQPPFPGGMPLDKIMRHRQEEPQPIEKLRPDVPPSVCRLLRRMMAKRPQDRCQSAAEVATILAGIAEQAESTRGARPRGGRSARRVWPWLAGAGGCLLLGLLVLFLLWLGVRA